MKHQTVCPVKGKEPPRRAGWGVSAVLAWPPRQGLPGAAPADNAGQIKAGAEGPRPGRSRRIAGESLAQAQPLFYRRVFVSVPGTGLGSWGWAGAELCGSRCCHLAGPERGWSCREVWGAVLLCSCAPEAAPRGRGSARRFRAPLGSLTAGARPTAPGSYWELIAWSSLGR